MNIEDFLNPKPKPPQIEPWMLGLIKQPSPPESRRPVGSLFDLVTPPAASTLPSSSLAALFSPPLAHKQPTPANTLLGGLQLQAAPPRNPFVTLLGGVEATPIPRRKVFISYHHANDEDYKTEFERVFAQTFGGFVSKAVTDGDISPYLPTDIIRNKIRDEFIQDATVTIVLIGAETWKRRHVDWEISASLRNTKLKNRCGLLGILLPTHPNFSNAQYDRGIIPPRLHDNVVAGYAQIYNWSTNVSPLRDWIENAFSKRQTVEPDNSYPNFINNKTAERWDG
jgi:hypothetical protein